VPGFDCQSRHPNDISHNIQERCGLDLSAFVALYSSNRSAGSRVQRFIARMVQVQYKPVGG